MKIYSYKTKNNVFEIVPNLGKNWFYPNIGLQFTINWLKDDEQFGFYIHLLFVSIYFDWFPSA